MEIIKRKYTYIQDSVLGNLAFFLFTVSHLVLRRDRDRHVHERPRKNYRQ
jgi:hypothetical protein